METKKQIIDRRVGGLGSSDAKMVASIARAGVVRNDNMRIAQMLGQAERPQFSTRETELGDKLEAAIYEIIKTEYPNVESNPYYRSSVLSDTFGFDVFNHIDYEVEREDSLIWIENKASVKSTDEVLVTYSDQLQWHWMLLEEKAQALGKKPLLLLSHYRTGVTEEFQAENLHLVKVKRTENHFIEGLRIIADVLPTFKYERGDVVEAEEINDDIVTPAIASMSEIFHSIKRLEEEQKRFKDIVCHYMERNGIRSIQSEGAFAVTYIPASVTRSLDTTRLRAEHPELAESYMKEACKKPYITIKTF